MFSSIRTVLHSAKCTVKAASPFFNDGRSAYWRVVSTANLQHFDPPEEFDDVTFPERRKLKLMLKVPLFIGNERPRRQFKRIIDIRGPEEVHTKLTHGKYGIVAQGGGYLRHGHIEMIRLGINKRMDEKRMFALWRIDPVWKPVTKKGTGHRMGGGKGNIDYYVSPIRHGRVIVEVGGKCEFSEVEYMLKTVAHQLPFEAKVVSKESLEEDIKCEEDIKKNNINPFTFEYIAENNILGCHKWLGRYDRIFKGKYR
ncbi:unnamed protein product [Owenia fusiformis]|uniref:Large ribosomal subunit protein uL16m n=1 Tax=Owenia fusiformis TaxID=6347 RepID=A0A8J1YBI2_OWEFU|nr:unnamed protein product [Owenia fusiformis]